MNQFLLDPAKEIRGPWRTAGGPGRLGRVKSRERKGVIVPSDLCPLCFTAAYLMFLKSRNRKNEASLYGTNDHKFKKVHNIMGTTPDRVFISSVFKYLSSLPYAWHHLKQGLGLREGIQYL